MSDAHSTKHIIESLLANLAIAVAKAIAAVFTGSGAMLAEAIHSASDCVNQLLLLLGVRRAAKAPDPSHPLGYGRALYFWSFMVAMLLFTGGGVFSIYEGVHKLSHPEAVENAWIGLAVLGFSLALEGGATFSNVREIHRRRGDVPFFAYLRTTKDSDLVVIFGENSAATLGLVTAGLALLLSWTTGAPQWDAVGTILVGVILVGVAVFLATETQSLLLGESADPNIEALVRAVASERPGVVEVLRVIAIQQGPGEVMLAAKVRVESSLTAEGVVQTINGFEIALKQRSPDVRWSFIEPDVHV